MKRKCDQSFLLIVALYVSAWIEILVMFLAATAYYVALYVSAWIEIHQLIYISFLLLKSHST